MCTLFIHYSCVPLTFHHSDNFLFAIVWMAGASVHVNWYHCWLISLLIDTIADWCHCWLIPCKLIPLLIDTIAAPTNPWIISKWSELINELTTNTSLIGFVVGWTEGLWSVAHDWTTNWLKNVYKFKKRAIDVNHPLLSIPTSNAKTHQWK